MAIIVVALERVGKTRHSMHGLVDHGWDYFIIELSFTRKCNSVTLTKDMPSQPHIINGTQWSIAFNDV